MDAGNTSTLRLLTSQEPSTTPRPLPPDVIQAQVLRDVYIWVLVAVGLPGNLASLVTVLSLPFTTATVYVGLLAAADSVALLVKLIYHQLITYALLTPAACVFYYSANFFSVYANWVLTLICLERFFTVCLPGRKDAFFSRTRVVLSVVLLTLALGACFSPTMFYQLRVSRSGKTCEIHNKDMMRFHQDFFGVFIAVLYFFAPFLLIAVFITLILVGLGRHRRSRQMLSQTRPGGGGGGGSEGSVERAISIMLLCAGLVFLVLTLPACIYHLFKNHMFDVGVREERAKSFLTYQVITMMSDMTHAVNFIIYFPTGPAFRRKFLELLTRYCCCCCSQSLGPRGEDAAPGDKSSRKVSGTELSQFPDNEGKLADSTPSA